MRILSEYWRKGQFQLWNPYAHCGEAQIAIPQPNLFYPANWIFAWLPFNTALALNLIGHQFVAGIGNFLLVSSFGWGFAPACLAGFVVALSAYMFSLSTNYTLMASASWMPIIIWSIRSLRSPRDKYWHLALSSLAAAMMILTGRPEIFVPALALIGGYILFSCEQSWRNNKDESIGVAALQLAALAFGVALSAPFILPSLEWQALSPRAQGLVAKEVLVWSANWYDFVSMILPQPLGDLWVHPDKFLNFAAARAGYPPYLIAFIGPVTVALALIGLSIRTWRAGWLLLAALVSFLFLSAGDNLPFAPYLVSHFPKLAIFRFPVKLLFFPVWFLSIFAARGLYLLLSGKSGKAAIVINLALWTSLVVAALSFPLYQQVALASAASGSATVLKAQELICQSILAMASMGIAVSVLFWLLLKEKLRRSTFSFTVVGSVYALLMIHAGLYSYHGADGNFFNENPSYVEKQLLALKEDTNKLIGGVGGRIVTLYFAGLLMPNKLLAGGDPDWPASYYQYGRQILTPSTHFDQKICSSFGYEGAETSDYRKLFVDCFNKSHVGAGFASTDGKVDLPFHRFCQITSTNYVIGMIDRLVKGKFVESAKLDAQYFHLLLEDRTWNIRIYKVIQPMPRIYMTYKVRKVEPEKAVETVANADSADFDPKIETLLSVPDTNLQGNGANSPWRAEFLENSANQVRIKLDSGSSGCLVLTDHFYPGWQAFVDGSKVPIYRANGVLRAVAVAAGAHTVEFKYEPDSLKIGVLIFVLSTLLLFIACGFLFIKRRRI